MSLGELAVTKVPRWALLVVVLASPVAVYAAFRLGGALTDHLRTTRELDLRMCRVEFALKLEPWPTCPTPHVVNGRLVVAAEQARGS